MTEEKEMTNLKIEERLNELTNLVESNLTGTRKIWEILTTEKKARQYAIYKGITGKFGALRFNLRPAYSPDLKKEEGVIFLEMAPAIGANQYDWVNQKVVMALNVGDVGKIIYFFKAYTATQFQKDNENTLRIYHDNSANNNLTRNSICTDLKISKPNEKDNFFFNIYKKDQEKEIKVSLPVSPDEAIIIVTLLDQALSAMLAW